MPRDLDSTIGVYIKHFRSMVKRLREYDFDPKDRILKKNILVSILDAVSKTTSNYADNNRERFTGIVAHFGDWPNHTRVSAPHISYLLRRLQSPAYEKAREFITQTILKNSDGRLITLSNDPELDDVNTIWPVSAEQRIVGQFSLSSFTHLNLLYFYRNSLVHELRELGHGMEFNAESDEPFYHGMTPVEADGSIGDRSLELVYPLGFYFRLTETAIDNVETYLRQNRIDPYGSYRFGSSWVGEPNR